MQNKHNEAKDTACAIFAGGKNSRMGRHKAFLDFHGRSFIDTIKDYAAERFKEVFIVTNDKSMFSGVGIPVFEDIIPGKGPLGALYTALTVSGQNNVFCVACDMPFRRNLLLERLLKACGRDDFDCFVPAGASGPEPLFAVYKKSLRRLVKNEITSGQLCMSDVLKKCRSFFIDIINAQEELVNINTPDDYKHCL